MQSGHGAGREPVAVGGRWAFWFVATLAALVHWIPHFPPQIDLAQHAAQMRMLRDWNHADFPYRDILQLDFFTPYLPAYFIGTALAFVVPTVVATKLTWTLGAIGTVYASVRLRKRLGGDAVWDWIVLPGLFGMTFVWGFLTFQLAVPLGLFGLEYWVVYLRNPTLRRGAAFGLVLVLLFFCHSLVTAWLMAVCGLMLLSDQVWWSGARMKGFFVGLPLLTPLPVVALWFFVVRQVAQAQSPIVWGTLEDRTVGFFAQWLGTIVASYAAAAAVGGMLLLAPFLAGARLHRNVAHRAPLIVTLAIILLAPNYVMGNAFTYSRFFTLLGPSFVMALAPGTRGAPSARYARMLMPGIAIGAIALVSVRMIAFDREQHSFRRIASTMLPNRHTLAVMDDASSIALQHSQTYLHFGSWYQAESGGLTEFSFAAFLPTIVHFRSGYAGMVPESFAGHPTWDFVRRQRHAFEYILVRAAPVGAQPALDSPFRLVTRDGQWWLFANESTR
jgi:hypothetical protein